MQVYQDSDADLSVLDGKKVVIVGYGNQGRAQALNMRDSGLEVIVGSVADASFEQAQTDGFPVMSISLAVQQGDVLCLLLPDEVQQQVYQQDIAPHLRPGHTLNFAHGYNIHYGFIQPPAEVNVIMVAPRMIGVGVRERFVAGGGAPAFVAVQQDADGQAWPITLAIARGIGATRAGALRSSFAEETELDHFSEQGIWAAIFRLLSLSYELLVENGYQPEAVLLEMYGSGEAAKMFEEFASEGLFQQMRFHSQTSQYGTLTRGPRLLPDSFKETLAKTLAEIKAGTFAREWEAERSAGYPLFQQLKAEALAHEINQAEVRMRSLIGAAEGQSETG